MIKEMKLFYARARMWFYDKLLRLQGWRPIETAPQDGTVILGLETVNLEYFNVLPIQRYSDLDEREYDICDRQYYIHVYRARYGDGVSDDHIWTKPIVCTPEYWRPIHRVPRAYRRWIETENELQCIEEGLI